MASVSSRGGPSVNFKVVLLGEGCVGKSSLVVRYVEDKFNPKHISTVQASFLNKKLTLDGTSVQLSIWDTAGQEKFHALGPIYYRSSNGAVLVYDITDEDSFHRVKLWVKELKKILGTEICLMIAGNKTDLETERVVDLDEAVAYATKVGAMHCSTSAKLNVGVQEMFHLLTVKMMEAHKAKQESENAQYPPYVRNILVVDDDEQIDNNSRPSSRSCCSS